MTTAPSDPDTPIKVKGLITDPLRDGFQLLLNYESTYWRAFVSNDAWSLYEVLRSFCHVGKSETEAICWPSINLLASILCLKERRVLTGYSKKVKGKVYSYPGLIEQLQEYDLLIAKEVGEGPNMRYEFHVVLTPKLLTVEQVETLPRILQEKHSDLLRRCKDNLAKIKSERRPSRVKKAADAAGNNSTEEGGSVNYLPPSVNYQIPSGKLPNPPGKLPTEQQPINNNQQNINHKTTTQVLTDSDNGETIQSIDTDVVVALSSLGVSKTVAQRLACNYPTKAIDEKIEYLEFILSERPNELKRPAAWLRKAIEDDYAAPDGFVPTEVRVRQANEEKRRKQAESEALRQQQELIEAQEREREEERAVQQAALREQFGTTTADEEFWEDVLRELRYGSGLANFALIADAIILQVTKDKAMVGIRSESKYRDLQHPGQQKQIERALKAVANKQLRIEFVDLND